MVILSTEAPPTCCWKKLVDFSEWDEKVLKCHQSKLAGNINGLYICSSRKKVCHDQSSFQLLLWLRGLSALRPSCWVDELQDKQVTGRSYVLFSGVAAILSTPGLCKCHGLPDKAAQKQTASRADWWGDFCMSSSDGATPRPWRLFIPRDLSLCLNGLSEGTHQFCWVRPDGHVGTQHESFGVIFSWQKHTEAVHLPPQRPWRQQSSSQMTRGGVGCQKSHASSPKTRHCAVCVGMRADRRGR